MVNLTRYFSGRAPIEMFRMHRQILLRLERLINRNHCCCTGRHAEPLPGTFKLKRIHQQTHPQSSLSHPQHRLQRTAIITFYRFNYRWRLLDLSEYQLSRGILSWWNHIYLTHQWHYKTTLFFPFLPRVQESFSLVSLQPCRWRNSRGTNNSWQRGILCYRCSPTRSTHNQGRERTVHILAQESLWLSLSAHTWTSNTIMLLVWIKLITWTDSFIRLLQLDYPAYRDDRLTFR